MCLGQFGPDHLSRLKIDEFLGGEKAKVPRGKFEAGVLRQHPQQGHGDAGQGFSQQAAVPIAPHPVEHHARQSDRRRAMVAEAADQCGEGTGLAGRLNHQNHRQIKLGRHRCGTAFAGRSTAIEKPHHPLHQHPVSATTMPAKTVGHPSRSAENRVEIATGSP